MRNLKRVLSLALAALMLMGMMVVGAGAASKDFTDASEIKNVEAVDVMVALGILEGGDKGDFQPNSILTREQAAKIICYMLLGEENAEKLTTNYSIFSDVPANRWSAPYISYCVNLGILAGDGAGHFFPEGKLTGVAFAKMLLVCLGYAADRENYVGNNWEINTSAAAISTGIAPKALDLSKELSRQDAAQMAFNTLQATMVEYLNDNTIIIGNTTVSTVGKATAVKQSPYTDTMDTANLQFAEKYFGGLKKTPASDAFDRPAISWRYNAKLVGTYTLASDLTYTAGVDLGDIYADLGLSKAKATNGYYVDGKEQTAVTLKKGGSTTIGGNGVLTQVWYDEHEDGTSTLTITEIHTYVGTVASVTAGTSSYDRYITINAKTKPANLNTKFETENFAAKDLVSYTVAENDNGTYEIQSVAALTKDATGTLTQWNGINTGDSSSNFTVDSSKYNYSKHAYIDVDGVSGNISAFKVDESELNVYCDEYGYALYVAGTEVAKDYAVVIGVGSSNQYGSQTFGATLLLADGTQKEVIAKFTTTDNGSVKLTGNDGRTDYNGTNPQLVTDVVGDLVTYYVNKDGQYELTMAGLNADKDAATGKYDKLDTTSGNKDNVYFTNGRSLLVIDNNGNTNAADGTTFYATDKTLFFVGTDGTGKNVYTVYQGYKNMPSLKTTGNYSVSYVVNSEYSTQLDAVYITAASLKGLSADATFVVKQEDHTVITDSTGSYFVMPAIINGEVTTVKVDAKKLGVDSGKLDNVGATQVTGVVSMTDTVKDKNDIYTDMTVNAPTSSANFVSGQSYYTTNALVAPANGVIGLGSSNKTAAIYWAYTEKTNFYVVSEDMKTVTKVSATDLSTDGNDKVFFVADDDATASWKVVKTVIVLKNKDVAPSTDTSFKTLTVKGQTAVKQADGTYAVTVPSTALNGVNSAFDFNGNGASVKTASYSFNNGSSWTDNWTNWNASENSASWNGQTGIQFKYVVVAADGVTTQTYVVKVNVVDTITLTFKSNDATQAYITVNGGTPTLIDNSTTLPVSVAKGSVVTLSIVPASGKTVSGVASTGNFVSGSNNSYQIIANATGDVVITLA